MNNTDLNKMNNIINSINQNNNVKNIKSKEGLFERTKVINEHVLTEDNKMLLKD